MMLENKYKLQKALRDAVKSASELTYEEIESVFLVEIDRKFNFDTTTLIYKGVLRKILNAYKDELVTFYGSDNAVFNIDKEIEGE